MEAQLFLSDKARSLKEECLKSLWLANPITPDLILKKIYSSRSNKAIESEFDDLSLSAYTDTEFHPEAIDILVRYSKLLNMSRLRTITDSSSELYVQIYMHLAKNFTNETHLLLHQPSPLPFSNTDIMPTFLHKDAAAYIITSNGSTTKVDPDAAMINFNDILIPISKRKALSDINDEIFNFDFSDFIDLISNLGDEKMRQYKQIIQAQFLYKRRLQSYCEQMSVIRIDYIKNFIVNNEHKNVPWVIKDSGERMLNGITNLFYQREAKLKKGLATEFIRM